MIGYHMSTKRFNWPLYSELLKNRQNHNNGNLGLWCGVRDDWLSSFGSHLYRVELHEDAKWTTLTVEDLRELSKRDTDYIALREKMLEDGYEYIKIVEHDREVAMFIVLDFSDSTIVGFEEISND